MDIAEFEERLRNVKKSKRDSDDSDSDDDMPSFQNRPSIFKRNF